MKRGKGFRLILVCLLSSVAGCHQFYPLPDSPEVSLIVVVHPCEVSALDGRGVYFPSSSIKELPPGRHELAVEFYQDTGQGTRQSEKPLTIAYIARGGHTYELSCLTGPYDWSTNIQDVTEDIRAARKK